MARKTKVVTVPPADDNRDAGKVFHITEMPALQAEKWAARALLAVARSRLDIGDVPENLEDMGWRGVAFIGLQGLYAVQFDEAEPLLDEMLTCVTYQPDPAQPAVVRPIMEQASDIEEVSTLLLLRKEVFELHASFFTSVFRSKFPKI